MPKRASTAISVEVKGREVGIGCPVSEGLRRVLKGVEPASS